MCVCVCVSEVGFVRQELALTTAAKSPNGPTANDIKEIKAVYGGGC